MGGTNATVTGATVFVPPSGSAPSASLILADSNGHALPTAATTSYFVNPLNLATTPITGDIEWSNNGTGGVLNQTTGGIVLTAPEGATNPSWIITIQTVYQPTVGAPDRIIENIVLSTANENGNSTGTPFGTVFQQTVTPFNANGPDPTQLWQVDARFAITSPGSITNDPMVVYPALEHTGQISLAPTLYDLTLNCLYVGDVPNYSATSGVAP